MQNILLFAARGDFMDIAAIVIFVVVGIIRFLYSIMKKPDVPAAGAPPQQPAAPKTPEALQQEIERFIRQAQGREPKPVPLEKQFVEQRPPEPVPLRQRLPAEERREPERREPKPREQNRPKPKKNRTEPRAPELAPTALSKRHVIDAEVQQSLGENRARRGEGSPNVSIEQHMQSAFAHKVGSLDTDVDNRSFSSMSTTAGKKKERFTISKDQIRAGDHS
jgi:cell division protein FtsN